MALGVPGLSEYLTIVLATLTVFTGWAGQGKTTLLIQIIASLIRQGIGVTLGTFETLPRPILERKLEGGSHRLQRAFDPRHSHHVGG
jgi:twinkle protein